MKTNSNRFKIDDVNGNGSNDNIKKIGIKHETLIIFWDIFDIFRSPHIMIMIIIIFL